MKQIWYRVVIVDNDQKQQQARVVNATANQQAKVVQSLMERVNFSTNNVGLTQQPYVIRRRLIFQRKRDLPEGESSPGSSRESETNLATRRATGSQDGNEKTQLTNVTTGV
jgi:hypothetical protein